MDKLNKITRIKFSVLIIYWLSFFIPIYSQVIMGVKYKISISELNAGTFFVLFFLVLIISTFVVKLMYEKYFHYVYYGMVGSMGVLTFILLFFKSGASQLRLTFFFQICLIIILLVAHFYEEITINVFDKTIVLIKKYLTKLNEYMSQKVKEYKEKKSEPTEESQSTLEED